MKKYSGLIACLSLLLLSGCGNKEAAVLPAEEPPAPMNIIISEAMPKNRSGLMDADGDFSDWIELHNISDEPAELSGWGLSDGSGVWRLPERELEPGGYMLVFASGKDRTGAELHTDFRLGGNEKLSLISPSDISIQSLDFEGCGEDRSLCCESGGSRICPLPTPGFENSPEGLEEFIESQSEPGELIINEVMCANRWNGFADTTGNFDWVEIKNTSEEKLSLAGWYLSDGGGENEAYALPDTELSPGRTMIILCAPKDSGPLPCTGFELSSDSEQLFLYKGGELKDRVSLHDIPAGASYGRLDGEKGFFYIPRPSPGLENSYGFRFISAPPESDTRDGIYENEPLPMLELKGEGKIYYTLDGSRPDESCNEYTGPIPIEGTCVIRAAAVQEGGLISPVLTKSFIVNEGHSLPVVSLVSDDPKLMRHMYVSGSKDYELPGSAAYYGPEGSFSIDCGLSLTGHDSIRLPKKSIKLSFRGCYGQDKLDFDVFSTGQREYSALALRAGQDNHRLIFRQEIWQDLCWELNPEVLNQHSKFCIVYINGEYYGIHCMKESIGAAWYADTMGVSRDSVESVNMQGLLNKRFREEVFDFTRENDMSLDENYYALAERLDVDNYIDWFIVQGMCNNQDVFQNVRFMSSPENGGKWRPVLFDLDHSMLDDFMNPFYLDFFRYRDNAQFEAFFGFALWSNTTVTKLTVNLLKSDIFRDKLISRFAEVYNTVLSNERVMERIDFYEALLMPEVERDYLCWGENPGDWTAYVDYLRRTVEEKDWAESARASLFYYLNLVDPDFSLEEYEAYFS